MVCVGIKSIMYYVTNINDLLYDMYFFFRKTISVILLRCYFVRYPKECFQIVSLINFILILAIIVLHLLIIYICDNGAERL